VVFHNFSGAPPRGRTEWDVDDAVYAVIIDDEDDDDANLKYGRGSRQD